MNIFKFKIFIIGILVLTLLIPIHFVSSLTDERKGRQNELFNKMGKVWGKPKYITGVVLTNRKRHYFPIKAVLNGNMKTEIRKKGIFEIPFYTTDLSVKVEFPTAAINSVSRYLDVLISDIDSVEITTVKCANQELQFIKNKLYKGIPAVSFSLPELKNNSKKRNEFIIKMKIKGIDSLQFLQFAKRTKINIQSDWKDPNFTGTYLPDSRTITDQGFQAEWDLINPVFTLKGDNYIIDNSDSFGINMFVPINIYNLTDRSIKYAILFISLTFLTFFIFESINKIRIHPIQYLMVGFALIIFYLLLLSFSEHIDFTISYILSTCATVGLITGYSIKILNEKKKYFTISGLLILLYVLLYVLLHLEGYSLMLGSFSLFVVLAIAMYLTRNIDWYEITDRVNMLYKKSDV